LAASLPDILACAIAAPLIAAGMISDVRSRRISNRLNLLLAAAGITIAASLRGAEGAMASVGGLATGLGVGFLLFMVGAIGAGDAKFVAALGPWLGPRGMLIAIAAGTILAGLLAVIEIARSRDRRAYWANLSLLVGKVASGRLFDPDVASHAVLNRGRASLSYGAFWGAAALVMLILRGAGMEWSW
jgi:Flp pilus assembly protein protease CpaA